MSRKRFDDMNCSVAQSLEQVGDWWTLLIVRDAMLGSSRFAQFESSLGIAKNILTDRLKRMVDNEVLERVLTGKRAEYKLTPKGRDLWPVLAALRLWGDRWVFGPGNEPILARDRSTGAVVANLVQADFAGRPIDPREIEFVAGPGAASALGDPLDTGKEPHKG